MKPKYLRLMATPVLTAAAVTLALPAWALDVNEQISVGGMLAAAGQCQSVSARLPAANSGAPLNVFDDECRGGMPIHFKISHRPDAANEFFVKLAFVTANGLKKKSPWKLASWGADLEDDVQDINGRNGDYLLTAWYNTPIPSGTRVPWAHPLALSTPPTISTVVNTPTTSSRSS